MIKDLNIQEEKILKYIKIFIHTLYSPNSQIYIFYCFTSKRTNPIKKIIDLLGGQNNGMTSGTGRNDLVHCFWELIFLQWSLIAEIKQVNELVASQLQVIIRTPLQFDGLGNRHFHSQSKLLKHHSFYESISKSEKMRIS